MDEEFKVVNSENELGGDICSHQVDGKWGRTATFLLQQETYLLTSNFPAGYNNVRSYGRRSIVVRWQDSTRVLFLDARSRTSISGTLGTFLGGGPGLSLEAKFKHQLILILRALKAFEEHPTLDDPKCQHHVRALLASYDQLFIKA